MKSSSLKPASNESFVPRIVGIGGTARPHSTSELAVAAALRAAAEMGAETTFFGGDFISRVPLYLPGNAIRDADEREYIESIMACDGVIIGTPGYHGSVSGPVKNILDLLEHTANADRPYLDGRAFGCIVTAYGWQACGTTLLSLRVVAHALRAWPTPFGATLNASTTLFDGDGTCVDEGNAKQLTMVAAQVVEFARHRHAGLAAG